MLSMKKVLIIGGEGFLGRNISDYFRSQGCKLGIYDVHISIHSDADDVAFYQGDVINDPNLDNILSQYNTVVYLISAIMPQKSMQEPLSSYSTDIPLLISLLEGCVRSGVKRVVYSSSGGTVYGENEYPNKENDLVEPKNHYAICKVTCENILQMYNNMYGMENIVLRISNPFGIGQKVTSGVGVVTAFANSMIHGDYITIYGKGDNIRDYIDVQDVARAFESAVLWKWEEGIIPIFNIGSGIGLSILQVADMVSSVLEIEPKIQFAPERKFDVKKNILDISKAKLFLGFNIYGNVEESMRKYILQLKD